MICQNYKNIYVTGNKSIYNNVDSMHYANQML